MFLFLFFLAVGPSTVDALSSYEESSLGSCVWTLGPLLVMVSGKVAEPLEGGVLWKGVGP